jgi:hypothetical protein
MKRILQLFTVFITTWLLQSITPAQVNPSKLPGFYTSPYFTEQVITFPFAPEVRIHINAPAVSSFNPAKPVALALFALPNGNTIEQTVGKVLQQGDDWHFDIQHIGAQTRFIRNLNNNYNLVTVYLETAQKSWPSWRSKYPDHPALVRKIVEYLLTLFSNYNPYVILTGHSGGGGFTFSFMDAFASIPSYVKRISFLDSDYNYDNTYGAKIKNWINASGDNYLSVIAYNDSIALYNGQPVVSPTGGTWYRSRMMRTYLGSYFSFTDSEDSVFVKYTALNGRIKFILKQNPTRAILHTVQVEKNGFIQGILSGTSNEGSGYIYYGDRAYTPYIQTNIAGSAQLTIPPRLPGAKTGSEFMQYVLNMTSAERDTAVYNEISLGNIPEFLRQPRLLQFTGTDAAGTQHIIKYEVLPDYLAIGSDSNFCRIPMGPVVAQKIGDLFGAVMPTRKLVDNIYQNCEVKLAPVTYTPVGNQNELVPKFIEHNAAIEQLRLAAGGQLGQLTGGTKKDVVLSNLIIDPAKPNHVVIYGWHQLNGQPIQPLTNIHINTYMDYSHGIRLLNNEILLDGQVKKITDILKDANLYKTLSDETGAMTQPTYVPVATLPGKPASFGIKKESSTQLRVIIKPDGAAQSYLAYISRDGINFTDTLTFSTSNFIVGNLKTDSLYYIKIAAANVNGASALSEVLAGMPTELAPKILIVNGFDRASTGNTYNFVRQHADALSKNGYAFETASNDAVTDNIVLLKNYKAVDYILGDESTADETLSSTEQALVKTYLQQGGKLFISGSEIAWDLDYKGTASDKDFIWNYLKTKYLADAPGGTAGMHYNVTSVPGTAFGGVLPFNFDNGTNGTINVQYPDVFKAVNGGTGCLTYTGFDSSYGYAGVTFSGLVPSGSSQCKTVTLGFPFETIYPAERRVEVMGKVLQFFDIQAGVNDNNTGSIPYEFRLNQNYPNPFNSSTVIGYSLSRSGETVIKLYDMLGREIKTIFSGYSAGGEHKIYFNAGSLASGTYIYKLTSAGISISKKMLLVK